MTIMPGSILLRTKKFFGPSYLEKWSRGINKIWSRKKSTESMSKILQHLENRSLIKIGGNEATDFLQGLVTNDMKHFEEGAANIYTLFLNIKGRVMYESIIYKTCENSVYYIECDTRIINDLQKHLKMYKIRRKVDIESLENKMKVWSTIDPCVNTSEIDKDSELKKGKFEGQIFPCGTLSNKSTKLVKNIAIYEDPRIPELSLRILTNADVAKEEIVKNLAAEVQVEENLSKYREFLYRLGIGEGIDDLPVGKPLPLEINCDYLHGVSFHKGCYIGQELTARTYHTGVVRKRLMPLMFHNCDDRIFHYDENMLDQSGKVVGKFRGRQGKFGLGLMRISEALNARTITISDCRVTVMKPRWWPKDPQKDKVTASDVGK